LIVLLRRLRRLRLQSRDRLFVAAALLAGYAFWLYAQDSPWTRAFRAIGRDMPELIAGFKTAGPGAALAALGSARADYLWFQAFDLAFVLLAALVAASAVLAAVKRAPLPIVDLRLLLAAPALYALCEFVENAMLALFASGAVAPAQTAALAQQIATTGKFAAGAISAILAAGGIAIAAAEAMNSFSEKWT
jgi:hypothetical protein